MKFAELVIYYLDVVVQVAKPAFARRKSEAPPNLASCFENKIAELQAAATQHAEQIEAIALQLKHVVSARKKTGLKAAVPATTKPKVKASLRGLRGNDIRQVVRTIA